MNVVVVQHKNVISKYIKQFTDEIIKNGEASKKGAEKVSKKVIDDVKRKALTAYLTNVFGFLCVVFGKNLDEETIESIKDRLIDLASDFYSRFIMEISDGDEKEGIRFDEVLTDFLEKINKK